MIIYIDDVLLILKSITKYFNNLQKFLDIIKQNGLVISTLKMMSIKNNFFRYNIYEGSITLIIRSIKFTNKFINKIKGKTQL
jgi:hypothetical protein